MQKQFHIQVIKKEKKMKKKKNLNNEILELEKSYEDDINLITQKKIELEEIRKHKLNGSLIVIRSRAKWITEGEKPTNYFFNLENRHYSSKIIPKIITEDDIEITNQNEILKEAKQFYENLYTKKTENHEEFDLEEILQGTETERLAAHDSNTLEGELTYSEATLVLKKMSNNKSPGSDGYTVEFFKFFGDS